MDLVQLQRIPNLLGFVAESTLGDTGERLIWSPVMKMSWDGIKQEVNAAYRVDCSSGPDSEIATGQWRRAFSCQLGDQLTT